MDEFATFTARLGAALHGSGTEADLLLLLHATTHALASLAGLLIPIGILYFISRRHDFEFRGMLSFFAMVGIAAALSQGLALWGMWQPDRWLQGTAQIATAALALSAAIALWIQLPHAIRLPSARQLRRANANLTRETWEQQRTLQGALHEAALLRGLVEKAGLGTALLSPAGRWLQINDAFAEALALPRTELLKQDPRLLLGPAFLDNDSAEEERECTVRDEARWYRWTSIALRGINGRGRARLIQCRDITAQKHAEQALAREREAMRALVDDGARAAAESAARLEQALAEKQTSEIELAARAARLERSAAQLEELGARLRELAGSDPETGLLSSHALADRLEHAVAAARRYGKSFSVLVIAADPLDGAGKAPLDALSTVLRAELRETDAAARCDEQRLCALLTETDAVLAAKVADRIRRRLASTPFAASDGRTLRLSCSIGAAEWKTGQGLGDVLGRAAEELRTARASRGSKAQTRADERGSRT